MMNFFKNGKLSGKGTAAIICFCLAAVAALGIFSYNKSAKELRSELSGIGENTSQTTAQTEQAENANINAQDVPITETNNENVILEHDAFGGEETQAVPVEAQAETGLDGAVIRPLEGEVIVEFSDGNLMKSKTLNVWKTHDGIDIAAESGTPVKSISAGTVTSVTEDAMMGVTVVIDHGSGYESYYSSLDKEVSVAEGDSVSAGTIIGAVGNTAEAEISEDSHLHLGVKKNGSWVDPAAVLSGEGS